MKARGFFITFEGGEATGKTTQIELLATSLKKLGHKVLITREPGGTALSEKLRTLLKTEDMQDRTELLLMEAARAEHTDTAILPALKKGFIVISDRYADSSTVYQGYCRGIPMRTVATLNQFATGGLKPDITILLEGFIGLKRMSARGNLDRFERAGTAFHRKVNQAYRLIAKKNSRIKVFKADQPIDRLHAEVLKAIVKKL